PKPTDRARPRAGGAESWIRGILAATHGEDLCRGDRGPDREQRLRINGQAWTLAAAGALTTPRDDALSTSNGPQIGAWGLSRPCAAIRARRHRDPGNHPR